MDIVKFKRDSGDRKLTFVDRFFDAEKQLGTATRTFTLDIIEFIRETDASVKVFRQRFGQLDIDPHTSK